jgi:hypothetical protein
LRVCQFRHFRTKGENAWLESLIIDNRLRPVESRSVDDGLSCPVSAFRICKREAEMWRNIGRAVTAICMTAMLINPAGVSAQMVSVEANGLASSDSPSASTHLSAWDRPSIRDWNWRPEPSVFLRATNQIRSPSRPAGRPQKHSAGYRTVQRVLAGAALGLVGFYGGGSIAFAIASHCECGGNGEVWIGAGVGAAAGATAGVLLVR